MKMDTNNYDKVNKLATVGPGHLNIEDVLKSEAENLYDKIEDLPYLKHKEHDWYNEHLGQLVDEKTDEHMDRYVYSFSDRFGSFDLNVKLAAKCDGPATCVLFPRKYINTLVNKSKLIRKLTSDLNKSFYVGECKVQPKKNLGRHCIMYCQASK